MKQLFILLLFTPFITLSQTFKTSFVGDYDDSQSWGSISFETSDGGYLVTGFHLFNFGNPTERELLIIKINHLGVEQWRSSYSPEFGGSFTIGKLDEDDLFYYVYGYEENEEGVYEEFTIVINQLGYIIGNNNNN